MKLLSNEQIKTAKDKIEEELKERVINLKSEEISLVKKVNKAKASLAEELKRIEEDLTLARDEFAVSVKSLSNKSRSLLQEVELLEVRKTEALKPIYEQDQKSQILFAQAKEFLANADRHKSIAVKHEQELVNVINNLLDQKEIDHQENIKLNKREVGVVAAEKEVKRSSKILGEKLIEFHKEVYEKNTELVKREIEVENGKRVNDMFKSSLDQKEKEQREHDRVIADRYATLERSIIRLQKNGRITKR
uniref:Uncharacterized protein n=1 Tax=viral metagenome TaxID=1070528 RepID=A0A6M3XDR8_9ZZZZ